MNKLIILSIVGLSSIISSCGKKTLYCREKDYYYEGDRANGKAASDQKRVEYDFTIGESYMNQDGTSGKYTKEYIEQQKAELESGGRFDCTWK